MGIFDTLLDKSIVFSFDRTGYARHARGFDPSDLAVDLRGRRVVITGATSGLGRAAAEALAGLGARVVLVCRDAERGAQVRDALRASAGHDRVDLELCDLVDLDATRDLADRLGAAPIHGLVHNAGALHDERHVVPPGLDDIAVLHVAAPLLLTRRLQGALADGARVVFVSSGGMYTRPLRVDRLERTEGDYDGTAFYADTKRAQVVLAEQLDAALEGAAVHSMHPGWAATRGVEQSLPTFSKVMKPLLRSPAQGADTIVWLMAAEQLDGEPNGFWFDRRRAPTHLRDSTRVESGERERFWDRAHAWAGLAGADM